MEATKELTELEILRAENARLREALLQISESTEDPRSLSVRIARAALAGSR